MKIKQALLSAFAFVILFTSCNNDDSPKLPLGDYENGILVSNEGPFGNGTGTISFISKDSSVVHNTIYKLENAEDLGNIVQSIGFDESRAYIVANNSQKISIVNRYTFKKLGAVTEGLANPRYFVVANGKGYVTNWGDTADSTDDYVAIINLETYQLDGKISVVLGPERIVVKGNKVYVAHKGAYGQNNVISVINTDTDTVEKTITVGDVPNSMLFDASGSLWVLAGGKPSYTKDETKGVLTKINTSSNTVDATFEFATTEHPKHLSLGNNELYYALGSGVYKMALSGDALPTTAHLSDVSFYTMTVSEGKLYGTDAKDYASKGDLNIYDLTTKKKTKTLSVGIIPGGIYFN
ncbi:MAG: DUF5074 domain-containing protein [Cellulophaga sp.]